jgi:hypothetical protein
MLVKRYNLLLVPSLLLRLYTLAAAPPSAPICLLSILLQVYTATAACLSCPCLALLLINITILAILLPLLSCYLPADISLLINIA